MSEEDHIHLDVLSEKDLNHIVNNEKFSQLLRELLPDKEAPTSIDPLGESADSAL